MAATRYFKAIDTQLGITRFRASKTRVYRSIKNTTYGWGFSGLPPMAGDYAAVEITKEEYDALNAAKIKRMSITGGNPSYASAANSWVANT